MSTRRKAYLRAMERAVFGDRPVPRETLDLWRPGLVAALDEVEPLIRTDERGKVRDDLRAKVQALPTARGRDGSGGQLWRSAVLDLLKGDVDG